MKKKKKVQPPIIYPIPIPDAIRKEKKDKEYPEKHEPKCDWAGWND